MVHVAHLFRGEASSRNRSSAENCPRDQIPYHFEEKFLGTILAESRSLPPLYRRLEMVADSCFQRLTRTSNRRTVDQKWSDERPRRRVVSLLVTIPDRIVGGEVNCKIANHLRLDVGSVVCFVGVGRISNSAFAIRNSTYSSCFPGTVASAPTGRAP